MTAALTVLIFVALGLMLAAVFLWLLLLGYRVADNRARKWRAAVSDIWLDRLLPVLEGDADADTLPTIRNRAELEAVLGLLNELIERFRGQYREIIGRILVQIGGQDFGLRLLHDRHIGARLRGCALLGWTGKSMKVDLALVRALDDRQRQVRVEAACALALRQPERKVLRDILDRLREASALASDRVRDAVRRLSPGHAAELAGMLKTADSPRLRVLILDGLASAGDLTWTDVVAKELESAAPTVREAAVKTLSRLADPTHIPAVALLVRDEDYRVRLAAARFAAEMGPAPDTLSMLSALARDPHFEVQQVAVFSLAETGGAAWDELANADQGCANLKALVQEAQARQRNGLMHPLEMERSAP